MTEQLESGSVIGILGGGQLGRMLSVAASRLGFKTCIFDPSGDPPAAHVANYHLKAEYADLDALQKFADSVDVVTYEFENIPTTALDALEALRPIRPGRNALAVSQDRLTEKQFLTDLGLLTAPFAPIATIDDLHAALATIGVPSILKTRRFGYDGKGQARIQSNDQIENAFNDMQGAPSILEGFVEFEREISVIGARGIDGEIACFDPGENVHVDGILRTTMVPSGISASMRNDAVLLTAKILNALDYVGVLGVELFVTSEGLIVNEIAPRVHNSGHWTQNGCITDQFEQHIRAIAGWSLANGTRHADCVMENLIGDDISKVIDLSKDASVALHLYGKAETKPGRKMGHFNRISPKS